MEKIKKFLKGYGALVSIIILATVLFAGDFDNTKSGYILTSTSAVTDTITTAGDSADGSLTFNNNDSKYKYLIVEYIQAAAPIKELVVASPNVVGIKMTYDEADSTIKLWASRHLGWVQLGFYAMVTSTQTETNTLARVTSANDTISGTTTIARNDTLTSGLTDQVTVNGATTHDSVRTITGSVINDGSGTDTYALINDGSGTVTGTETTAITMTDPNKIIYELVVTPDSGTKTVVFTVRGTNYLVGY